MNRRTFVYRTSFGTAAVFLLPTRLRAAEIPSVATHHVARVVSVPEVPLPAGKRRPFGWQTVAVAAAGGAPLVLAWPDLPDTVRPTHFRFAVGLDERDEKTVEVSLPKSGRVLGAMELRFVSQFQVYA